MTLSKNDYNKMYKRSLDIMKSNQNKQTIETLKKIIKEFVQQCYISNHFNYQDVAHISAYDNTISFTSTPKIKNHLINEFQDLWIDDTNIEFPYTPDRNELKFKLYQCSDKSNQDIIFDMLNETADLIDNVEITRYDDELLAINLHFVQFYAYEQYPS